MSSVFISYRRQDTQMAAGRLAENLEARFGHGSVVIDVDTDQVGRDYRQVIIEHLEECAVVVALIGDRFLGSGALGSRRIDSPDDLVRLELTRALERDVPVIPVTVDGAQLPDPQDLPAPIRDLVYRGAVELAHHRFERDVSFLADRIERILQSRAPSAAFADEPGPPPLLAERGDPGVPSAAWRRDPTGRYELRYWNGVSWTEHVSSGGQRSTSCDERGRCPCRVGLG